MNGKKGFMKRKSIYIPITAVAIAITMGLGLTGCGTKAEEKPAAETETAVQEQQKSETTPSAEQSSPTKKTLGTKSEQSLEVKLKNGLDKPIESLSLRSAGSEEFEKNLVQSGTVIEAGEEVVMYVTPAQGVTEYDLALRAQGDQEETVVEAVPLSSIKSVTIKRDGENIVADYAPAANQTDKDKSGNGETEEAVAGAAAVAVEQQETYDGDEGDYAAPEAPAAEYAAVEVEAPVVESAPVAVEESAPAQSSDACLGDVVLRD